MLAAPILGSCQPFSTHRTKKLCSHVILVRALIKPLKCSLTIKKNRKIEFQKSYRFFSILYLLQTKLSWSYSTSETISKVLKSFKNYLMLAKTLCPKWVSYPKKLLEKSNRLELKSVVWPINKLHVQVQTVSGACSRAKHPKSWFEVPSLA